MLRFKLMLVLCLAVLLVSQNISAGRYYNAAIGRFLQVDPLADKYPGWSPYNYTLNNPVLLIDPDGNGPLLPSLIQGVMQIKTYLKMYNLVQNNVYNFEPRETVSVTDFLSHVEGKKLDEITHEADTKKRIDSSAGGPISEFRYVEDPANAGYIIDMRHFLVIGQLGREIGMLNEVGQLFLLQESAFMKEDFYSNLLGDLFFRGNLPVSYDSDSDKSVKDQLSAFFEWWVEIHKTEERLQRAYEKMKERENEERNQ